MKKLMTMIAAVATAFGLYAADSDYLSGTSFEAPPGGALSTLIPLADELIAANGAWNIAGGEATVVAYATAGVDKYTGDRPQQFNPDNLYFLNLKTGSDELTRYALGTQDDYDVAANGNYYFDSVVQLSAFDEDPSADITGAKLALWLLEDEDAGTTNLMIKVGSAAAITADGDYSNLLGKWARVTIKALPISDTQIGFVLFIDTTAVVVDSTKTVSTDLNPVAQAYQKDGVLIVSGTDTEISSVGFKGTGLVDDIVFTQTLPGDWADDPAVYTIKWDPSKMANVMTNGAAVAGTSPVIVYGEAPATMNISWTGVDKWASGSADNVAVGEDGNFDFSTITVAEADATFGGKNWTIAKAVELANAATADGELALLKDVGAIEINNTNTVEEEPVVITLDLAGKKIQQPTLEEGETPAAAITLMAGSLKIIDSDGAGIVAGNGVTDQNNAIDAWDGALEIAGGTFNGVVGAGENVLTISSETPKFAYAANVGEDGECTISYEMSEALKLAGKQLVADPEDAPTYWIVGKPKVYVAQIGTTKFESFEDAYVAAQANDKIELIADWTMTNQVLVKKGETDAKDNYISLKIEKNITIDAGEFTLTGPNRESGTGNAYGLVIAADVTIDGGTFKQNNGQSASFINVGNAANGDFGADAYSGKLTWNNATYNSSTAGGNAIAAANGSVEINSGTFNCSASDGYGPKAEGSATITINGGTFNCASAAGALRAKENGVITVNAGTFDGKFVKADQGKITIPSDSTATFDRDQTAFCAEGYKTVKNEDERYEVVAIKYATLVVTGDAQVNDIVVTNALGETIVAGQFDIDDAVVAAFKEATFDANYELDAEKSTLTAGPMTTAGETYTIHIAAKSSVVPPITPGGSSKDYNTAEEAAADAAKTPIMPAPGFDLADEALTTWQGYFENKVYASGDKFRFAPMMNADGSNAVAQAEAKLTQAIKVADIAAATGAIATMELSGAEPGFYYTLFKSADVKTVLADGSHDKGNSDKMAKADGKVTFTNVAKPSDAAGFFSVKAFDHANFTGDTTTEE